MNNMYIPQMCSINEAHKKTGLPYQFIRGLVRDKKIPYVKSGKKFLVNLDRLIDLISNGETTNESAAIN